MGFRTRTVLSQFEDMQMFFVFLEVLLGSVGAVALLVAALGIVNTLLMSVLERYQEIGISWLLELGVNLYAQSRHVTGHLDLFDFPWWLLVATVLFSCLVSILSGVYPALRAARVDVIRVLRRE